MRIRMLFSNLLVVIAALIMITCDRSEMPLSYAGEEPPGIVPKIFAEDIISSRVPEFSCTFSSDGKEFYFTRIVGEDKYNIFVSKETTGGWSEPELAPFSGDFFNHEPYISWDGNKIYWGSVRPLPSGEEEYSIWISDRVESGWGEPYPLGFDAMYITASRSGTLYYTGRGRGGAVLAKAELIDGKYEHTILAEPILSDYWDGHPCISPDESYIIFDSENRPESDECGLFISFKLDDGGWSEPQNMKSVISKGSFAMLSPDGEYLFYSGPGKGEGKDYYWVDAQIIEQFRK